MAQRPVLAGRSSDGPFHITDLQSQDPGARHKGDAEPGHPVATDGQASPNPTTSTEQSWQDFVIGQGVMQSGHHRILTAFRIP